MGEIIDKCVSFSLSRKYKQKICQTICYRYSKNYFKKLFQKTAEATGGLIGNKVPDLVAKSFDEKMASTASWSKSDTTSHTKIPGEGNITPEKIQKTIDQQQLI